MASTTSPEASKPAPASDAEKASEEPDLNAATAKISQDTTKLTAKEFVGPPAPGPEDLLDDKNEIVLQFEHDRPDLTPIAGTDSPEPSPAPAETTAKQLARADQIETIEEAVMPQETISLPEKVNTPEPGSTPQESPDALTFSGRNLI